VRNEGKEDRFLQWWIELLWMFKYRDTCQMRVVVAMETQLFHACCNDNWSLYMHTTIKIQSRELFHYFTIIIVQWFMIKKKFTITTPMSRFATILSTTVWRVQDKTTMTSINIKDQQVRVTIESYAKKKKKKKKKIKIIYFD
jgi:hypothetical protein